MLCFYALTLLQHDPEITACLIRRKCQFFPLIPLIHFPLEYKIKGFLKYGLLLQLTQITRMKRNFIPGPPDHVQAIGPSKVIVIYHTFCVCVHYKMNGNRQSLT